MRLRPRTRQAAAAFACALGAAGMPATAATVSAGGADVSVKALSRGAGVPEEARYALMAVRSYVLYAQSRGDVRRLVDEVIGLEGETSLCVTFRDEDAANRGFSAISAIVEGVALTSVSRGACAD